VAHGVLKEVDELAGERPHRHWAQPSEVNGPYLERGKEVRRAGGVGVPAPVGVGRECWGQQGTGIRRDPAAACLAGGGGEGGHGGRKKKLERRSYSVLRENVSGPNAGKCRALTKDIRKLAA
jgi:hypothetical protein